MPMKALYLFIISFLLYFPTYAQLGYGKPKDIIEIKKRPLIIMLESEDRKLLEKYSKKPEKLVAYQNRIADVNQGLRTLGDHWEFNDDIQFMEYHEIRQLQKKKKNNYAVLYIQRIKMEEKRGNIGMGNYEWEDRLTGDLSLALIENLLKKKPVSTFSLASPFPDKGDLVSTGRILVTYMNDRLAGKRSSDIRQDIKNNAHRLPNKILLLDQEMLDKNLRVDKINNHYPYPTLVTDSQTIEEAILRKDPKFAYITIVPMKSGATQNLHLVIDAEDSKFLGYSPPHIISLTLKNDSNVIYTRHLENYHKLIK
jgi:hypothetical protein